MNSNIDFLSVCLGTILFSSIEITDFSSQLYFFLANIKSEIWYLVHCEYYPKISAKLVKLNNILKSGFFPDFQKNRIPDPEFFWPKPPSDKDGANQKKSLAKFSSRSGVIREFTDRQTDKDPTTLK